MSAVRSSMNSGRQALAEPKASPRDRKNRRGQSVEKKRLSVGTSRSYGVVPERDRRASALERKKRRKKKRPGDTGDTGDAGELESVEGSEWGSDESSLLAEETPRNSIRKGVVSHLLPPGGDSYALKEEPASEEDKEPEEPQVITIPLPGGSDPPAEQQEEEEAAEAAGGTQDTGAGGEAPSGKSAPLEEVKPEDAGAGGEAPSAESATLKEVKPEDSATAAGDVSVEVKALQVMLTELLQEQAEATESSGFMAGDPEKREVVKVLLVEIAEGAAAGGEPIWQAVNNMVADITYDGTATTAAGRDARHDATMSLLAELLREEAGEEDNPAVQALLAEVSCSAGWRAEEAAAAAAPTSGTREGVAGEAAASAPPRAAPPQLEAVKELLEELLQQPGGVAPGVGEKQVIRILLLEALEEEQPADGTCGGATARAWLAQFVKEHPDQQAVLALLANVLQAEPALDLSSEDEAAAVGRERHFAQREALGALLAAVSQDVEAVGEEVLEQVEEQDVPTKAKDVPAEAKAQADPLPYEWVSQGPSHGFGFLVTPPDGALEVGCRAGGRVAHVIRTRDFFGSVLTGFLEPGRDVKVPLGENGLTPRNFEFLVASPARCRWLPPAFASAAAAAEGAARAIPPEGALRAGEHKGEGVYVVRAQGPEADSIVVGFFRPNWGARFLVDGHQYRPSHFEFLVCLPDAAAEPVHPPACTVSTGAVQTRRDWLEALRASGLSLAAAPAWVQADRELVLVAVRQCGWALERAAPELAADPGVVLAAVRGDGSALKFAATSLKSDKDVALAAVSRNGLALEYVGADLFGADGGSVGLAVARAAVAQHGEALQFVPPALRADRGLVISAVRRSGGALRFAPAALRCDREVVMAALKHSAFALKYASDALRGEANFVLEALQVDWRCLEFALDGPRGDQEVVLQALAHNGQAMKYATPELKASPEFAKRAVQQCGWALEHVDAELRGDKDVALLAVKEKGSALQYATAELRSNHEVVLAAVSQRGWALNFAEGTVATQRDIVDASMPQLWRVS